MTSHGVSAPGEKTKNNQETRPKLTQRQNGKKLLFFFLNFTEIRPKGINKMLLTPFFSIDKIKQINSFCFVNCSIVSIENPFYMYKC